ncbi:hypothetical protein PROFUN_02676 [Planoprotostelium fungivorum]|uniref:Uncharacterized protein n=1 Tax=Planoprotostelium fungivorum TaxID=1890364 RepID=A0A2P6NVE1_9EUKA|nr:hypothetical protein PROFUN_02676 [Planoprotostelium fungivorum]
MLAQSRILLVKRASVQAVRPKTQAPTITKRFYGDKKDSHKDHKDKDHKDKDHKDKDHKDHSKGKDDRDKKKETIAKAEKTAGAQ